MTQDMNNHDVPEYFADDETVFDFFGAGADHQAVQVGSFTDQGRSGIPEGDGEDVLEDFHNGTDLDGLADLREPLFDVENPPAQFRLNTEDTSIVGAQAAPWDPGRAFSAAHQGTQRYAPSIPATFTSDAAQREAHQYPSLGYVIDGRLEAQHAHSSTNFNPYSNDLLMGRHPPEGSYSGHTVESAPISSQPPSVWSWSDRMQQYLSPTSQDSQPITQAGEVRDQGITPTSTTRSVRSAKRRVHRPQRLSKSTASKGSGSSSVVKVSAGPSNDAGLTSRHVCSTCNKTLSSATGLKRHRQTHDQDHARMNAHKCPTCQKGFRYKKDVKRHLTTHDETKEHSCPLCSKTFTRKDNAKRHLDTHSTGS